MVQRTDYYLDLKYCRACGRYVRYISALHVDHCIECDARVWLFSDEDRSAFERARAGTSELVRDEE
jgi:hypothetical protein